MSVNCAPCHLNYDYIVKFERLGEGEGEALKHILAPDYVEKEAKWYNPNLTGEGRNMCLVFLEYVLINVGLRLFLFFSLFSRVLHQK